LEKGVARSKGSHTFRVYSPEQPDSRSWEESERIAEEELGKADLAKLGIGW